VRNWFQAFAFTWIVSLYRYVADQDLALDVNDASAKRCPGIAGFARPHIIDHRDVVVRAGRGGGGRGRGAGGGE
jgi:hypothetical protein